jgi:hypothetical protein
MTDVKNRMIHSDIMPVAGVAIKRDLVLELPE